jgi:hypothetical protein
MIHEIFGLDDVMRRHADHLAGLRWEEDVAEHRCAHDASFAQLGCPQVFA